MNKRELLKENCMYKLFLLSLENSFNELAPKCTDIELRKYFRRLCVEIENLLEIKEKIDISKFENILDEDSDKK